MSAGIIAQKDHDDDIIWIDAIEVSLLCRALEVIEQTRVYLPIYNMFIDKKIFIVSIRLNV